MCTCAYTVLPSGSEFLPLGRNSYLFPKNGQEKGRNLTSKVGILRKNNARNLKSIPLTSDRIEGMCTQSYDFLIKQGIFKLISCFMQLLPLRPPPCKKCYQKQGDVFLKFLGGIFLSMEENGCLECLVRFLGFTRASSN